MARATGWTLDYIDNLPLATVHEWLQIMDAEGKAGHSLNVRRGKR